MSSLPLYVESVGVAGPGLAGWEAAKPVLRGESPFVAAELPPYQPQLLPPNERRRAPAAVRIAFRAAEDAASRSAWTPAELAAVFASSDADTPVLHRISSALAEPARPVSPTDFHNSVHNAAAGYWSIAASCREPSISLAGWDSSFAAGLMESAGLVHGDGLRVLLVVYDIPPPPPLYAKRPIATAFGSALILTAEPGERTQAMLRLQLGGGSESQMQDAALEALRLGNPAARALPLLQALALGRAAELRLPAASGQQLQLSLSPA